MGMIQKDSENKKGLRLKIWINFATEAPFTDSAK